MSKPIFIAIEGLDSVGKNTQSTLLASRLQEIEGVSTNCIHFPNYNGKSSNLVQEYLKGEYPGINRKVACSLYAIDRYLSLNYDKNFKVNGPDTDKKFLISDRFTGSNMIHQLAFVESEVEKRDLADFIYVFEHGHFSIPIPDLTIYLDLDPEVAYSLNVARSKQDNRELDIHETKEMQIKFNKNKEWLFEYYDNHVLIDCNSADGGLLSVEEISNKIMDVVSSRYL